jgi:hypothetical protein
VRAQIEDGGGGVAEGAEDAIVFVVDLTALQEVIDPGGVAIRRA